MWQLRPATGQLLNSSSSFEILKYLFTNLEKKGKTLRHINQSKRLLDPIKRFLHKVFAEKVHKVEKAEST